MGLLARLRDGLSRTRQQHIRLFDEVAEREDVPARRSRPLDSETADEIEDILIAADVGLAAAQRIVAALRSAGPEAMGFRDRLKREIRTILDAVPAASGNGHRPHVMLVVGVNGTGKTTTVGKLAKRMKAAGRRPLVCAADTYRAAAVEQLTVWASRADVDIIRPTTGADPAAVVFDALTAARARDLDVVIVDTAGRLHTRVNLMLELEKIARVTAREVEAAPHEVLLVLDATVGQNGLVQAREFAAAAGVTGIVLTKLDGTAKGGVAIAIAHDLRLPIQFVGVGEGIDDLLPFSSDDYVDALFEQRW